MTVCFHFSLSVSGYGYRRQQALDQNTRRRRSSDTKDLLAEQEAGSTSSNVATPRRQKNFLKSAALYQNSFLYVFARLFMTTSLIYIPLWLDERTTAIGADDPASKSVEHIATVPLVSFIASFVSSVLLKYANRILGHQISYFFGSLISICGCVWVRSFMASPSASSIQLYGIAILFGAGSSITMISSLCITADMIGRNADQSGFIYSAVTFADKLITGIAVVVIESM